MLDEIFKNFNRIQEVKESWQSNDGNALLMLVIIDNQWAVFEEHFNYSHRNFENDFGRKLLGTTSKYFYIKENEDKARYLYEKLKRIIYLTNSPYKLLLKEVKNYKSKTPLQIEDEINEMILNLEEDLKKEYQKIQ